MLSFQEFVLVVSSSHEWKKFTQVSSLFLDELKLIIKIVSKLYQAFPFSLAHSQLLLCSFLCWELFLLYLLSKEWHCLRLKPPFKTFPGFLLPLILPIFVLLSFDDLLAGLTLLFIFYSLGKFWKYFWIKCVKLVEINFGHI